MTIELEYKQAKSSKKIQEVFEYTTDAFSDSPDFNWTLDEITKEVKDGWELYACIVEDEIIAAIFLKEENDALLSKNTAIKMNHHGSGYSHQIKEFIERITIERKLSQVKHYCRVDNFRMYSLNERHGYKKTKEKLGNDGQIVEWIKIIEE